MNFIEKAILINLFGDEWGGGEAWDAYELWKLWHKSKRLAILIIAGILLFIGLLILLLNRAISSLRDNDVLLGTSIAFMGVALILGVVGAIYYYKHPQGINQMIKSAKSFIKNPKSVTSLL